jgi:hypothetical protein
MWSYQPLGPPLDGSLAFVTAKLAGNGSAPPVLEVVTMIPFLPDEQAPALQPSLFAIGTVTRVFPNDKSFLLSGQEYIVCSKFSSTLCRC